MTVTLVQPYNPDWLQWFEQVKEFVVAALEGIPHTIEHVGSTAVPGMTAKPIIDLIIVTEPGAFGAIKERLQSLAYIDRGDLGITGREAFGLTDAEAKSRLPAHHVYVCEQGAAELRKEVAFRDFLRRQPEWLAMLSALKRSLCEQHANDRQAYMDGKADLVLRITKLALGESEEP